MSGLPYYATGTISADSADSSLALSGGDAASNIGIGWLLLCPDGPSGAWQAHVVSAVPSASEIDIVPPTSGSLSGASYVAVRASGMDAKAIADLNALLTSSNYSEIAELTPGDGTVLAHTTAGGWEAMAYLAVLLAMFRGVAEAAVASATTCEIAGGSVTSPFVVISNNNTITSLGTAKQAFVMGRVTGTPTFTEGTYLKLNKGGNNHTCAAGDRFFAWSDNGTTPVWYVTIFPASGRPTDANLSAIAALSPSNDDILQRKAGAWTNRTMAQLLTDLGSSSNTWTPTITTDGTAGTPAYTEQTGTYEIINGKLVVARGRIQLSGWTGSPTGTLLIGGLPATAASSTATGHAGPVGYFSNVTLGAGYSMLGTMVVNSTATAKIAKSGTGVSGAFLGVSEITPASFDINFVLIYRK